MADKPIAKLVGEVGFVIDSKALDQFFRRLQQTESQMRQLGKLADGLVGKLNKVGAGSAGGLNTKQLAADVARLEILLARVAGAKSKAQMAFNKEALSAGKLVFAGRQSEAKLQLSQLDIEKRRLGVERLRQTAAEQSQAAELRMQAARRRLAESTALYEQRARNLATAGRERTLRVERQATMLQQADFRLRLQKEREARRASYSSVSSVSPGMGIGRGAGFSLGPVGGLAAMAVGVGLATSAIGRWTAALQQSMAVLQGQQYAVSASAGGGQAGAQANAWLSKYADSRGLDRSAVSDQFAGFLASGKGAGLSNEQSQNTFAGFADLGTTLHLSSERQAGALRAVSQMLGKNQVQAEELRGQLAEHLPGAVSLFAEAWAKQTGSGKTEQAAIADLNSAMQKGLVKTQTVLLAAQIAAQRAAPTLAQSSSTAQSESNRANNRKNDFILSFAQAGGDKANAGVFKAIAQLWQDLGDRAPQLARMYSNLATAVEAIVLRMRALIDVADRLGVIDGLEEFTSLLKEANVLATNLGLVFAGFAKNSDDANGLLGKWLSPEEAEQFRKDVSSIQTAWNDLSKAFSTLDTGAFGTVNEFLSATAREVAGITSALRQLLDLVGRARIAREDDEWSKYQAGDPSTRRDRMSPYNQGRADDLQYGRPIRSREQFGMDQALKGTTGLLRLPDSGPLPPAAAKALAAGMAAVDQQGKAMAMPGSGSSTVNSTSTVQIAAGAIVVNAAPGQSAEDIAGVVRDEIGKTYGNLKAGQTITK
ncbi:tape measure protein [Pseudomonas oryzihabitans]|uniref:tape measure protein n=1 Tax=Pseudomonas oryzihabitans TaxID=47885 RepID=UPI003CF10D56